MVSYLGNEYALHGSLSVQLPVPPCFEPCLLAGTCGMETHQGWFFSTLSHFGVC